MNCNTGELRRLNQGQNAPEGFLEVPDNLRQMALDALGNEESVFLPKSNPIRKWAKNERKKQRSQVKASRKKNR